MYERFIDACEANNVRFFFSSRCHYGIDWYGADFVQGGVIDDNEDNVIRMLNLVIQRLAGSSVPRSSVHSHDFIGLSFYRWSSLFFSWLTTSLLLSLNVATFTDPQRATDDLQTFAKMNEKRLYKLLRTVMGQRT